MSRNIVATRYHDFCAGHRVVGHEGKCRHLHGHNYRVTFHVEPDKGLDPIGRVLDFSVIKASLCEWIEQNWDHKMLLWEEDMLWNHESILDERGCIKVPFNPTAENMAKHLVHNVGPLLLEEHHCTLTKVQLMETRKCGVEYSL